jgi:hypothetical protein
LKAIRLLLQIVGHGVALAALIMRFALLVIEARHITALRGREQGGWRSIVE